MNNELTKFELLAIMNRIEEIDKLLDFDLDIDIMNNLIEELDEIIDEMESRFKKHKIKESGLRLV